MKSKVFYEPKTLRKIQLVETEMLKEFVKICKENNIDYFIAFGTVIGVLRHGGFIPWDDDIDLCMSRSDFERFCEIVSKPPYSERYEMISAANSDDFFMPEAHWQFKGTKFVDAPSLVFKNPPGIFLDFFVLDNLADDEKVAKKQKRDAYFWCKVMVIRAISKPIVPFKGVKGKIASVVLWCLHYLLKTLCISKRWIYNKYKEAATRFNNQKTKRVAIFRSSYIDKTILTQDDIYPLRDMKFEDVDVKIAHRYENTLEIVYGDYMRLPPAEKQHNHCPDVLDFGDSLEYFGIE